MFGSWFTVLAWTFGIIIGAIAVYGVLNMYIQAYLFHKDKNESKATFFKDLLINSTVEIAFVLFIIGCIIFVTIYGIEPANLHIPSR